MSKDEINQHLHLGLAFAQSALKFHPWHECYTEAAFGADALVLVQGYLFEDLVEDSLRFRQNPDEVAILLIAVPEPQMIEEELQTLQKRSLKKLEEAKGLQGFAAFRAKAEVIAFHHAELLRISPTPNCTDEVARIIMGHQMEVVLFPRTPISPLFPALRWDDDDDCGVDRNVPRVPYTEAVWRAVLGGDDPGRYDDLVDLIVENCRRHVDFIDPQSPDRALAEYNTQKRQLKRGMF